MREISYIYLHPVGGESEERETLDNFLSSLPHLLYMGYLPPINIVNLFLKQGIDEAGMGGGAEWTPFEIDNIEYSQFLKIMESRTYANNAKFSKELINTKVNSKNEWYAKVMEHKLGIPFKKHLELMELEQELKKQSQIAAESGQKEIASEAHLKWYNAAQKLNEFCLPYFKL